MAFVFKDWYEQNKEDLNKARRDRYEADPEHQKHVRELNAESRKRRRKEVQKEAIAASKARKIQGAVREWKEFDVEVPDGNGGVKTEKAFTIGALAAATRRSIQSLRAWEKAKVIPPADATSGKGDRLYTVSLIEKIVTDLEKSGRLKETMRQRRGIPRVEKMVRFADGREERTTLFLVAALAQVLERTIITIQGMEGRGVLPKTPFRASTRRYRLYTVEQIEAVKARFREMGDRLRDDAVKVRFHDAVKADWEKLGVMDAVIIGDTDDAGPEPEVEEEESDGNGE